MPRNKNSWPRLLTKVSIEVTRPSALGMSDPVMEFLVFPDKGQIFLGGRGKILREKGDDFSGRRR